MSSSMQFSQMQVISVGACVTGTFLLFIVRKIGEVVFMVSSCVLCVEALDCPSSAGAKGNGFGGVQGERVIFELRCHR